MTAYTRTEHLRHELAEQIRNGTLKPGERIMSETRLAEEYQVSRGTVRRALEQLKKAELIETRMGSGSYVAFNGGDMSGPDGWTSASLRSGAPTTTELLSIALVGRPLALEGRASANGSTKSRAAGSSGRRRSRTRSRICPPSRRCARSSNEWKDSWTAPSRKP